MLLHLLLIPLLAMSHFTMREGLSQNTVFSIAQDRDKNMWIATYEGINRFDGYNFKVYYPERDPDFVQVEGADQRVFVDSRGQVWAYDGGLSRYDAASDSFISLKDRLSGVVMGFAESASGDILVALDGSIVRMDAENAQPLDTISVPGAATALRAGEGIIVAGTESGELFVISDDGTGSRQIPVCRGTRIKDVQIYSSREIWCAAGPGRFFRVAENGAVKEFSKQNGLLPVTSWSLLEKDASGRIVIVTKQGFAAYNRMSSSFVTTLVFADDPINVKSIYCDPEGGIWIGSFYRGLYYYQTGESPFRKLNLGIPGDDLWVCSINEDTQEKLWISTMSAGMLIYNPRSGAVTPFRHIPSGYGVMKSYFSPDGTKAYFGSGRGFAEYDFLKKRYYEYSGGGFPVSVYSILPAPGGRLWLGTLSGLYVFDCNARTIRKVEESEGLFIFKLSLDQDGTLWAACESGLFRAQTGVSPDGGLYCRYFKRVSDARDVHDILRLGDRLFAAARNGLYAGGRDGSWTRYDQSNGFSSNFLSGLEADVAGRIWIGSEYGLNSFDTSTGDISRYFADDGTGIDSFTKNSHCAASDGALYFGGVGGVVRIDPVFRGRALPSDNPRITGMFVNGTSRPASDLRLSHSENSVYFRFAVANHSSGQKNRFYYRLEKIDREWIVTDQPVSGTYSSLPPGKYRFELKSFNKDGLESPSSAVLSFEILPPWWASRVALFIFIVLGVVLLAAAIVSIVRYSTRKAKHEAARIAAMSQAEIDRLTVLHYTGSPVSAEDEAFVLKTVRTIEKNISDESFGVEQLADAVFMSRSNLFIRIKRITGESPLNLLRRIRLEKACELLRTTDKQVADIAMETGFGSAAYFCTCFKKEMGVTPNNWRK